MGVSRVVLCVGFLGEAIERSLATEAYHGAVGVDYSQDWS